MQFVTTWVKLEVIVLDEISQMEKDQKTNKKTKNRGNYVR